MHFVFLNQYYPPDVAPTGVMLEGLVRGLIRDGHEVTVLCAQGGYAGGGGSFERRTSNFELRNEEKCRGVSVTGAGCSNSHSSAVRSIRIGATRFGRSSLLGKLADYSSFYLGVAWRLLILRPRPDRIVALTTPPYLSVLARALSKLRGADHAHWVMDLYPDVMAAHGMMGERSLGYRILSGLARWGYGGTRCAAILTLGPDMAERVGRYVEEGQSVGKVKWVPLWGSGKEVGSDQWAVISEEEGFEIGDRESGPGPGDRKAGPESGGSDSRSNLQSEISATALRRQREWPDDELIVMYSGNMGLGHRFGEIFSVARDLAGASNIATCGRVRFVFFGGGKRRREVEEFLRGNPGCHVELHDYAPAEMLVEHLRSADVHLASLDAEWTGTMVPSKLQGIFEAGRPVIFIGDAQSSIGTWVNESGGGWVVRPGDVAGLYSAIREARNPEFLASRGAAAKSYAESHFDKSVNVSRAIAALGYRSHP